MPFSKCSALAGLMLTGTLLFSGCSLPQLKLPPASSGDTVSSENNGVPVSTESVSNDSGSSDSLQIDSSPTSSSTSYPAVSRRTRKKAAVSHSTARPNSHPEKSLTCGRFVQLWENQKNPATPQETPEQAVAFAKKCGDIPEDVSAAKPLDREILAYLLTAKNQEVSGLDESHYDWQIADYSSIDPAMRKYALAAYAKGLMPTKNGDFKPQKAVSLGDAQAVLSRLSGKSKPKLPPNTAAPYFEYRGLVNLKRLDPSITLDLKYATRNNFTGKVHYSRVLCLLEAQTAKQLVKANRTFHKRGYTIKVWDAYRPVSVQWSLYYATPENLKPYAPAPSKNSQHSKGIAADITLVDQNGKEMKMPTGFDDFTKKAHADFPNLPNEVLQNRAYLRKGMEAQGFTVYRLEWWHFYLPQKTSLSISNVSLDDFAQKEKEFYTNYLKKLGIGS